MALTSFIGAIRAKLLTFGYRVYYGEEIDGDTKVPYIYFQYTSTNDTEPAEDFMFDVDIVGYSTKLTQVEQMVDAVDGDGDYTNPTGLNYYQYGTGGSPTFNCYRVSRLSLPSGMQGVARRQLRYRVRTYL